MTSRIEFDIVDIINRLNERTVYDNKTGCWRYWSCNSSGYGILRIGDKYYYVHRLSAHIFLKLDITDRTKHALHKTTCPNKNCWNWNHLYIGDNCDNMRDLKNKRRKHGNSIIQ